MGTHKQYLPSFASFLLVLSVVLFYTGFLKGESEINQQRKRTKITESNSETDPASIIENFHNIAKITKEISDLQSTLKLYRNKRSADHVSNTTETKETVDMTLEIQRLIAKLKPYICKSAHGKSVKQGIAPGDKGEPGDSISAPVVVISSERLTVNEGDSALFQCSVSGNPEPAVAWSKLNSNLRLTSPDSKGRLLLLTNVAGKDSGTYICLATNIAGHAQKMVQLIVNVHPRVSLLPGPLYAIHGSNYTLPACHVTGYPAPVVTWRKSSGQLPQNRVKYNNSALQILHVRKDDSDSYFCSAYNLLGRVEKKTVLIAVSPPRFTVKPPAKVFTWVDDTLSLNCSATGDPQPVIKWSKQEGELPTGWGLQTAGLLVIRNTTKNDTGDYVCVATIGVFKAKAVTSVEVHSGSLRSSSILGNRDNKYFRKLNCFLDPVLQNSRRSRFVRCWHAKTDGWAASTFHSNCDGKGPTVTIVQVGKHVFGGYTDSSWSSPPRGSCHYGRSAKAFVYSLHNINGYSPAKMKIRPGRYHLSTFKCDYYGPTFGGGWDLHISNYAASNTLSETHCGSAYPLPPGYSSSGYFCTFYAGINRFTPTDVEVFYETTV